MSVIRNEKGQFVKGSGKGDHFSKERRDKISISHLGKKLSKEHCKNIGKSKKGIKRTEEEKQYLSLFWKGKKKSKSQIENIRKAKLGNKNPMFGKRFICSKSCRKKISETKIGDKNPNYIDGRTPENQRIRRGIEYRLWRESVFARDNWTCQKTGIKGGMLHSHHIKNFSDYPELRFAIDNGATLSKKSHKLFHKRYGYKNNTKEQLEEFLKN